MKEPYVFWKILINVNLIYCVESQEIHRSSCGKYMRQRYSYWALRCKQKCFLILKQFQEVRVILQKNFFLVPKHGYTSKLRDNYYLVFFGKASADILVLHVTPANRSPLSSKYNLNIHVINCSLLYQGVDHMPGIIPEYVFLF